MTGNGPNVQHAFISYVHEDRQDVDKLQAVLEAAGISVWRDTENLWPGEDWKIKIRKAITIGSLAFIACFSKNTERRQSSYQNEELILAAEQMRLLPPGRVWFLPIRFSECELPDFDLGAGRTLNSLQRVDLFGPGRDQNVGKLVAAVFNMLGTPRVGGVEDYSTPVAELLKSTLLASDKQIEFEDLVAQVIRGVREELQDSDKYPVSFPSNSEGDWLATRFIAKQAEEYMVAVDPVVGLLVPGCTYGRPEHESVWTRLVKDVANADKRSSGRTLLINLSRLPALVAVYTGGMAAVHRGKFGALRAVVNDPVYRDHGEKRPMFDAVHPWRIFDSMELVANLLVLQAEGIDVTDDDLRKLKNGEKGKRYTPISDYLHTRLRNHFADLIVDDDEYTENFDNFEVYLGLIGADAYRQASLTGKYIAGPYVGSFSWRHRYYNNPIELQTLETVRELGDRWPPLQHGLFGGSVERATKAAEVFATRASEVRSHRW